MNERSGWVCYSKQAVVMVAVAVLVAIVAVFGGSRASASAQEADLAAADGANMATAAALASTCALLAYEDGAYWLYPATASGKKSTESGAWGKTDWAAQDNIDTISTVFIDPSVPSISGPMKVKYRLSAKTSKSDTWADLFKFIPVEKVVFLFDGNGESALRTIGKEAFCRWSDTESYVNLEKTKVTSIGSRAFENCSSLLTLDLPRTLKTMSYDAFRFGSPETLKLHSPWQVKINGTLVHTCLQSTDKIYVPNTVLAAYRSDKPQNQWVEFREEVRSLPFVSLAKAKVSGLHDVYYKGVPVKPKPTVKVDGKTLVEGRDYTLSYRNNDKPGKSSVTVKAKGITYGSQVTKEFHILAPENHSKYALLKADGNLYRANAKGQQLGKLTGANSAAVLKKALNKVTTLFIDSDVKYVPRIMGATNDVAVEDVSASSMRNLRTVWFLTSAKVTSPMAQAAINKAGRAEYQERQASGAVKSAKTTVKRMKKAIAKRSWYEARGSYGYFQFYANVFDDKGAAAAAKALLRKGYNNRDSRGGKFTSYTRVGAEGDATSMSNFVIAVNLMSIGNKLRCSDGNFKGTKELYVSDVLMAMAQSNANWSDKNLGHAALAGSDYNVGENLAYNYVPAPYQQWYNEEKALYDAGSRGDEVGHYLNLVNRNYTATGFGVCSRGSMNGWATFTQEFAGSAVAGETLYTVDEYKLKVNSYYGFLKHPHLALKNVRDTYRMLKRNHRVAKADHKTYEKEMTTLVKAGGNACRSIERGTFAGCRKLRSVENLDKTNVEEIGINAFKGCASLSSVSLPISIAKVGKNAFAGCAKLPAAKTPRTSLANAELTFAEMQKWTGTSVKPKVTVNVNGKKLKAKRDYTLVYSNNRAVGNAEVAVIGKGQYCGSKKANFHVVLQ